MIRDALPYGFQALGILAAILGAVFAPQPKRATLLVPLSDQTASQSYGQAARWASDEGARIVSITPQDGAVIVIAPSRLSLARALSYGLVPIAAEIPTCTRALGQASSKETVT